MLAVWPYRGYIGTREAVLRVRSHISPGPYRSFRELSLAGPVGSDIWCPPTFVGNSGIERFNGICGFALFLSCRLSPQAYPSYPAKAGYPVRRGSAVLAVSALEYW